MVCRIVPLHIKYFSELLNGQFCVMKYLSVELLDFPTIRSTALNIQILIAIMLDGVISFTNDKSKTQLEMIRIVISFCGVCKREKEEEIFNEYQSNDIFYRILRLEFLLTNCL